MSQSNLKLALGIILGTTIGFFGAVCFYSSYESDLISSNQEIRRVLSVSNPKKLKYNGVNPWQSANQWEVPKEIREARYAECENDKLISKTGGFCLTHQDNQGGNQIYDRGLAEFLAQHTFAGKTVVDLGAGLGHYGKIFMEEGSKVAGWTGYDGALNVQKVTNGLVKFMELTQPEAGDERECAAADYVLSLEVGEHIPPEFTDAFLRNIRCHATEGAVISWAPPGQGGTGHQNMKGKDEVIRLMEKWGFEVDQKKTALLRKAARNSRFKRNTVVYKLK